jgi:hypothetical protein
VPLGNPLGDIADALGRAHRGAAIFVNDEGHDPGPVDPGQLKPVEGNPLV